MKFESVLLPLTLCLIVTNASLEGSLRRQRRWANRLLSYYPRKSWSSVRRLPLYSYQPAARRTQYRTSLYSNPMRYNTLPYRTLQPPRVQLYQKPFYFSPYYYGNYRNRRRPTCPWDSLSHRSTKLLTHALEEYSNSQYTVKCITSRSEQQNYFCSYLMCLPKRYEICITFILAPTDGCHWREKCSCIAQQHKYGRKCRVRGSIQSGSQEVQNLKFYCEGGIPAKTTTTTTAKATTTPITTTKTPTTIILNTTALFPATTKVLSTTTATTASERTTPFTAITKTTTLFPTTTEKRTVEYDTDSDEIYEAIRGGPSGYDEGSGESHYYSYAVSNDYKANFADEELFYQ